MNLRRLKEIRIPTHAEQLENEDKPFVAVFFGDGGEHNPTVEVRITRDRAMELQRLHDEGKI